MSTPSGINLKLVIAYDGTNYLGWQKTSEGPSIEAAIQTALEQIAQHPIVLQAASRTDAGVHAQGQVANFIWQRKTLDLHKLWISLNCLLPKDISILSVSEAEPDFHPTLDCMGKKYVYKICYAPVQLPQNRLYEWHYHYPLDISKMRQGALLLEGKHDYSAFKNSRKQEMYTDHMRTVEKIIIEEPSPFQLVITVSGDHFMYKMVRNLIGTLVYIGAGKISLEKLLSILAGRDRTQAGITAPAHGLTLQKVQY